MRRICGSKLAHLELTVARPRSTQPHLRPKQIRLDGPWSVWRDERSMSGREGMGCLEQAGRARGRRGYSEFV